MAMQPPQPPPPNGAPAGLAGDMEMARLGFMARWHCDRCGLGFDDFDACEAHEAGCNGVDAGADIGAGGGAVAAQAVVDQGPPAPVVIPDDEADGARPAAAAAAAAVAVVPQRAHQHAPAIIPIHNDGDTSVGGSVAAAAAGQRAAAPAVAQPARAAREEQEAIDLTIDESDSDSDGSSDGDGGDGNDDKNDDDDDDDVVVVDDADVVVVDDAESRPQHRAHAQSNNNNNNNNNTAQNANNAAANHRATANQNQRAGAPLPAAAAPAGAAAPPPPKRGVVTVWTCDVCGVAEFDTFEAAAAHEEACAAKKEREDAEAAAAAAARKAQQQMEAAAAAAATTTATATAAQNRIGSVQQHPSNRQNQQQQPPIPLGMAALPPPLQPNHQQQTSIPLGMAALPPPLQPNRPQRQAGAHPQPQPQHATALERDVSNGQRAQQNVQQQHQQQQQQQQHESNSNINPAFQQQDTKYWSCDICNASFQSYDEACKHERECEGNPNAPVKSITTFQGADGRPISDEASQLTEPVTLDDDQEPPSPPQPEAPYWTCDHCQVARFDTYEQASAHERICRAVAKQLGQNDGGTGATSTTNNYTTAVPDRTPPAVAATTMKTAMGNMPMLEQTRAVKLGQQKTLTQDAPQKRLIPPETVFPLMHEQFTKDKSLAVPAYFALALDQLVLAIKNADTSEGAPSAGSSTSIGLDLCCRHCKERFPVTSTEGLRFEVERVTASHLMGKAVCKSMPVDVQELMEKLQNIGRIHGTDEETKASIRNYSQYVVERYSLVNLADLKAKKSIGMLSFKDNLSSSLELARSASDAAIKARIKALRDELRSKKDICGDANSRKRPSSSDIDIEDEESLDSSPADKKRSAKRRRDSKSAANDGDDDNISSRLVCMVDEDLDGHEYYVPPSGGVPLVSTQSASIFSELSLYYQIVISNIELYGLNGEQGKGGALQLRCHNCKSNPDLNTFVTLSNCSRHDWHKAVKHLAKHVEQACPCLASHTLHDLKSSRRNKKEKALAAYCEFLTSLYRMKDSTLGLVWDNKVKPITYEYASKPKDASDKSKNIPPSQLPRHNLMLPPGSAPKKTIIPDYFFFLASQYHFTLVKRQTSPSSNGSVGSIDAEPDVTLAICCRHCNSTRPLESIRDGCSSSRYLLKSHFESCPATGSLAGYLDDLKKTKATQEKQCSTSIITCMKNTMTKVYGMVDLEWNGECSGVGFSAGLSSAMRQLSKGHNNVSSWGSFQLPLLPQDSVRPVTEGLRFQI